MTHWLKNAGMALLLTLATLQGGAVAIGPDENCDLYYTLEFSLPDANVSKQDPISEAYFKYFHYNVAFLRKVEQTGLSWTAKKPEGYYLRWICYKGEDKGEKFLPLYKSEYFLFKDALKKPISRGPSAFEKYYNAFRWGLALAQVPLHLMFSIQGVYFLGYLGSSAFTMATETLGDWSDVGLDWLYGAERCYDHTAPWYSFFRTWFCPEEARLLN